MKRRSTILTLATLTVVAFIGIVSAAPYPALRTLRSREVPPSIGGRLVRRSRYLRLRKHGCRLCPHHERGPARLPLHVRGDLSKLAQRDLPGDQSSSSPRGEPARSKRPTASRRSTRTWTISLEKSSGVVNIPSWRAAARAPTRASAGSFSSRTTSNLEPSPTGVTYGIKGSLEP